MDGTKTGSGRFLRLTQGVAFAFLAAFAAHALFRRGDGLEGFFSDWVYNGLVVTAAASCLVRSSRRRGDRLPWGLLGLGLLLWSGAEITNTVYVSKLDPVPYPSISDALWLAFYPAAYVALLLPARVRGARAPPPRTDRGRAARQPVARRPGGGARRGRAGGGRRLQAG